MNRLARCLIGAVSLAAVPSWAQEQGPPQTPSNTSSATAAASNSPAVSPAAVIPDPRLADENLLLFDVSLDRLSITDSLATYAAGDSLLIPLGELTRLLDIDVAVFPSRGQVTGSVGEARRPILIDVPKGLLRLNGAASELAPGDVVIGGTDMYVRPALLERLLPVTVTIDSAALRLVLKAREPLPIQSRLDRLARLRDLQPDIGGQNTALRVAMPYRLLSVPSFDVALATGIDKRDAKTSYRYDVRAGADFLHTGFQGYLGSDDKGKPSVGRLLFERRDLGGNALGPLGLTRVSAGDVFTPTLPFGVRSVGGRGLSFTTASLEQASVFDRIDLRGELPLGYDVELYVNDVLRSGQGTPVRGRYEFLNVPLVRGVNVIRVVAYGPRGERNEQVRVVSVGGGQLAKGAAVFDFGIVQQERNLFDLRQLTVGDLEPGHGKPRVIASMGYGVSSELTLTLGGSLYAPSDKASRGVVTGGVRTSLLGWAAQVDVAHDTQSGRGLALGLSGQPFGISTTIRHNEYRHGFIDETIPNGADGRALIRYSDVTFDLAAQSFAHVVIPVAGRVARDQYANGDRSLSASLRASTALGRALVSAGLDIARLQPRAAAAQTRVSGTLSASTYARFDWQLRGTLDYALRPSPSLRAATLTADRNLSARTALRLGLAHSFEGDRATTGQASAILRLPIGDVSIDGDYSLPQRKWRIGVAVAFSLAYDPLRRDYAVGRTGAGSGGNLALKAFIDANDNDIYDPGERPVSGVALSAGGTRGVSDEAGRAFVTGLGYGPVARANVNLDEVDLGNFGTPPTTIEYLPRAGVTAIAMYPLRAQNEALVRLLFRQPDGRSVGLSAVRLRAVGGDGKVIEASTEYDGSALFEKLRTGTYAVDIDPEQAGRLKMKLSAPLTIVVPAGGAPVPDQTATVIFE